MTNNMWDNYLKFMNPETKNAAEINAWIQNTMDYMDDFVTFSKKVCEMKATPDDVMALWENASKKIQGSVSECMKMFGVADSSELEQAIKKYEAEIKAAGKTIDDQKKKIKDQDKEISAQKKEIEKLNQSLSDQKKEADKLTQSLSEQKKEADRLNQIISDNKKEITKLQQTISSLETTAVKAASPNTNQ